MLSCYKKKFTQTNLAFEIRIRVLWLDWHRKENVLTHSHCTRTTVLALWRRQILSQKIKPENLSHSNFLLQIDDHNPRRIFIVGGRRGLFHGQFSFNTVAYLPFFFLSSYLFFALCSTELILVIHWSVCNAMQIQKLNRTDRLYHLRSPYRWVC